MTDQQLLGIHTFSDKTEIRHALINKISNLDFEIDIEQILRYVSSAQRLIQKTDTIPAYTKTLLTDSDNELLALSNVCNSPEELIEYFTSVYNTPTARFNKLFWTKALDYVKSNDKEGLHKYCKPIADFFLEKPFIPSDIIKLVSNTFPYSEFFPDPKLEENQDFWKRYNYIHHLLRHGNVEFDLLVHTIDPESYTAVQLDELYSRILNSAGNYRAHQYAQAFTILSQGIPDNVKPLVLWQRKINILYKAAFIEKENNADAIFEETLNAALSHFPTDEQLLYMHAKYIMHTYHAEQAKDTIIDILKIIPDHAKCLFLLGRCYLQLGISRAALAIFENLTRLNPLQMQYVTSAAIARRQYIDFCMKEYDSKTNSKEYYVKNITALIEQSMFDEALILASEAPKDDNDTSALLLYTQDLKNYSITGKKNLDSLNKALSVTSNKEIIRNIKAHYLKNIAKWSDIKKEETFINTYYTEYPDDAMSNYHMGMYYYSIEDYLQAYTYFLNAKEIDPLYIPNYFNLASAAGKLKKLEEAIQYISIYLQYNKYHLPSNELYNEWTFAAQQYANAHTGAKWTLSICRTNEFLPSYFFYFTVSLGLHLNTISKEKHNPAYIYETLELYDQYPKPELFWIEENGPKSMYWAAKLCYDIGDYKKSLQYINTLLKHTKDHTIVPARLCLFELLPKNLNALQQYKKLIQQVTPATQVLLANDASVYEGGNPCFYLSMAHNQLEHYTEEMYWAIKSVYCYIQTDNPPMEWIENYLTTKFETCLEYSINEYILIIGNAYLNLITPATVNHSWFAYHIAATYELQNNQEEALNYHRKCLAYSTEFPDECHDERNASQFYISTHSTSDSIQ